MPPSAPFRALLAGTLAGTFLLPACDDTTDAAPDAGAQTADAAMPDPPDSTRPAAPDDAGDASPDAGPPAVHLDIDEACDNLVPQYCPLPWPSNRWLTADASRATGFRLAYDPAALPVNQRSAPVDVTPYERLDGFSPSSQIITLFDEPLDLTDLPGFDTLDRSLEPDCPTVILDLSSGERVAHWVEHDIRADAPEETLLYLRPAERLQPDRTYGVALRRLVGISGTPIVASPVFAALRDAQISDAGQVEARRPAFETLFAALTQQGIDRSALQLAWSFHTESFSSAHDPLLVMRTDALERIGQEGMGCTITDSEDNYRDIIYRRVRGTFTVPWYLNADKLPAELVRDEEGFPTYVEDREVGFTALLPRSVVDAGTPGPLVVWGHGLFGEAEGTISRGAVLRTAESAGVVIVGTDWAGMSAKDLLFLGTAMADISRFYMVGEMLQQGMINQIALTRTMMGRCRLQPEMTADGASLIDPETRYFVGGSQGSILGGTFLTLSPDIDRGALVVGGTNLSFMIERSIHYNTFEPVMQPAYPRRLDRATIMVLSQHTWDRAESASYLRHTQVGLPGIGPKSFLYLVAHNDAQVPNLASFLAARLARLPVIEGSVHVPWGRPVVEAPYPGSAYLAFDFGDRLPPPGNASPQVDDGGHGEVAFTAEGMAVLDHFLTHGEIIMPCDGPCVVGP